MSRQKKLINKTNYPQHAIEKFARCVYPDIVAFYQSEEGQREFAEWQAEQAAKKAQRKLHTTKKEVTAAVTSVVILWAFSSVGLLAWKWEECGSRWGSRLARIARNKQIIRTRPRLGRTGSDYIALVPVTGLEPVRCCQRWILSYSSHSEPNGLNRNKTVFSVTFQNIKNPKKPYKISIFDAKHQKYKQFVPSSIIGNQIPNLRRWRDVGGM